MISAKADDGIVEAIEWEEKEGKPFFMAIQWHPERVPDRSSPFSKNILEKFRERKHTKIKPVKALILFSLLFAVILCMQRFI